MHFGLYTAGDFGQPARVVYNRLVGTPNSGSTIQGCDGHGTLNSHIVAGYVPDPATLPSPAVHADGSAFFRVPANTPVSVQPLDREGKALQHMRSWFTAMPGEVISCVGCHEPADSSPPLRRTLASVSGCDLSSEG